MPPHFHLCFLLFFCLDQAQLEQGNVSVYAALGGQAEFILHVIPSGCSHTGRRCSEYEWRKQDNTKIANFKEQNWTCVNVYKHKCKGYENGSLQLSNISTEDSGYYFVDLYNTTGTLVAKLWFLLQIQDPISEPKVNYSCLKNGTIQFSCSVQNGTDPVYSWAIEGMSPVDNCIYTQNGTCTISITSQLMPREVKCTVKNQISTNFSRSIIASCPDPVSEPKVNYSCLKNGTILQLSCSVQSGTDPEYSWTIEGMSPMDNCTYSQNGTCTISIASQLMPREVTCTVKNQISMNVSHSINASCPETSTSALAPTLASSELPSIISTVDNRTMSLDNRTMPKNINTSWTDSHCLQKCIMKSAIWGSVVLLVTSLALILGCLYTMPKE
ncbi:peroxidasin homolog isoform X2 [Microcaecilia unicolor]|uniref:Peroxidasin homolog isoform X2 n=1 Tax=Microcaecilia unicolor TaxID=1415580 RepID=A0A6P7Y4B5_9AMPH|nr:peroxidasin homolog isoform X2 [Microcaecilia unicolor]